MKKVLALLLSFSIISGVVNFSNKNVLALEIEEEKLGARYTESGDVDFTWGRMLDFIWNLRDIKEAKSTDDFENVIKETMKEHENSVLMKVKDYSEEKYGIEAIVNAIDKNPIECDGYKASFYYAIGNYLYIDIKYYFDKDTLQKQKIETDKKIIEITNKAVKSDMSKAEKAAVLHDYVVKNAEYNTENTGESDSFPEDHSAYGVLVKKKGVCDGYAKALSNLFSTVGIENKVVYGVAQQENHAWNIVKLDDGKWYNIDATWNDPVYDKKEEQFLEVIHSFFNRNDEYFNKTHKRIGVSQEAPKCDGSKYSPENMGLRDTGINGEEYINISSYEQLDKEIMKFLNDTSYEMCVNVTSMGITYNDVSTYMENLALANGIVYQADLRAYGEVYIKYTHKV